MSTTVTEASAYNNITSTTTIKTGTGSLLGIFVSSATSSPTIKVADGATTAINTFTPLPGTFYPMPFYFGTSLIVTIGGTVDCCVMWNPQA